MTYKVTGSQTEVKEVQNKILEVMKFIDKLCRDNGIVYFIMGGAKCCATTGNWGVIL